MRFRNNLHQNQNDLRCPVAMGKRGTFFLLVEFNGEPFPGKKGKHALLGNRVKRHAGASQIELNAGRKGKG